MVIYKYILFDLDPPIHQVWKEGVCIFLYFVKVSFQDVTPRSFHLTHGCVDLDSGSNKTLSF